VARLEELSESRYASSLATKGALRDEIGTVQAACEEQIRRIADADRGARSLESEVESTRRRLSALAKERDDDDKRPKGRGDKPRGDELGALFGSLFSR
jgi:chromosome segregation ATPase